MVAEKTSSPTTKRWFVVSLLLLVAKASATVVHNTVARVSPVWKDWPASVSGFLFGSLTFEWAKQAQVQWDGLPFEQQLFLLLGGAMGIDILTGTTASFHEGTKLSSTKARRFVEKMIGYLSLVGLSHVVTNVVPGRFDWEDWFRCGATGMLVGIETLSILENVDRLEIKRLSRVTKVFRKVTNAVLDKTSRVMVDTESDGRP